MSYLVVKNRHAYSDYAILEKFEAGIKLTGAEVKSVKAGAVNLKGSYASFAERGGLCLFGVHISAYKPSRNSSSPYNPERPRQLLLSKKELNFLLGKLKEKRLTLVPLAVLNKNGLVKIELGLGRGLKKYEKKDAIKRREQEREIRATLYS